MALLTYQSKKHTGSKISTPDPSYIVPSTARPLQCCPGPFRSGSRSMLLNLEPDLVERVREVQFRFGPQTEPQGSKFAQKSVRYLNKLNSIDGDGYKALYDALLGQPQPMRGDAWWSHVAA